MYQTRNTYERKHTFNHSRVYQSKAEDLFTKADPNAICWKIVYEQLQQTILNMPLPSDVIVSVWNNHIEPLSTDLPWKAFYDTALVVKEELDELIHDSLTLNALIAKHSQVRCAHSTCEVIEVEDEERISFDGGEISYHSNRHFASRCLACGEIIDSVPEFIEADFDVSDNELAEEN